MLAMTVSALAGNVVTNADFEQRAANGLPADWTVFCPPVTGPGNEGLIRGTPSLFSIDSDTLYKGKATLRISSPDPVRAGLVQGKLPIKPGQRLRFSCWMKGENVKVGSGGAWVRLGFSNFSEPGKHQAAYRASGFLKSRKANFDWEFYEEEVTVPAETDHVEMGLFLWHTSGTVWFAAPTVEIVEPGR